MSISQIKKQFEEFATYLGRDTTGLEKLRKLKESVNVLRNDLTAAKTNESHAVGITDQLTRRAVAAEQALAEAKQEIHSLKQRNQNLLQALEAVNTTTETAEAEPEVVIKNADSEADVKRVMKQLRSNLKFCPPMQRRRHFVSESKCGLSVISRNDIATGWSHDAIWVLGATMAILAAFEGEILLRTDQRIRDIEMRDPNADDSLGRPLIQWFCKHNVDVDPAACKTGLVRLTNLKPDLSVMVRVDN